MKSSKKRRGRNKKKPSPSTDLASRSDPPEGEGAAQQTLADGLGEDDDPKQALDWLSNAVSSVSVDQIESDYREIGGDPFAAAMKSSKKRRSRNKKKPSPSTDSASRSDPPEGEGAAQQTLADGLGEDDDPKQALDWLSNAVSSVSVDQIESDYREVGCDTFEEAAILGTPLDDPGEGNAACLGKVGMSKGIGAGRKQKRIAAATGLVSDVIGKGYCGAGRRHGGGANSKIKEDMNCACSVEEAEQFLCSMFGGESELDMAVVRDVLCQYGCDIEKLEDKASDSAYHLDETEKKFESYNRNHANLFDDSGVPVPAKSESVKTDLQQQVLESLFSIPKSPTYEPNRMNWKKVLKKMESFDLGLELFSADDNLPSDKEDAYQVFRSVPKEHWDMMRTYYQKAADAYSRGERVHASCLSEKGKFYRDLARQAEDKASREIFEIRNKHIKNMITIDLHGQHVKKAIQLLKRHLLLFTYVPSVQCLKVITGCGADVVGKGKLKRAVLGLVKKEGITYTEENAGSLVLRLDAPKQYSFMDCGSDSE